MPLTCDRSYYSQSQDHGGGVIAHTTHNNHKTTVERGGVRLWR